MKVVLLGFTVSDERMADILASDTHMPTQTHSFAWSVVRALRAADVGVSLLSSDPLTSYPGNPEVVVRGGAFEAHGVDGLRLGFLNMLVAKHLTRFWSCLTLGTKFVRRIEPEVVLVHGVHSPYVLYGLWVRRVLRVPVVVILTDPPGVVLPTDSRVVSALKRLDTAVVRGFLARLDGVVALTAPLAEHFAPGRPALLMEGIVDALPDEHHAEVPPPDGGPSVVMYAGGLSEAYGVRILVDAVRRMADHNVLLRTYGRGELAAWITEASETDPRIEAPKFASRSEVVAEYSRVSVLVQPRPVDQGFVRYSFPSKLMEYLASGTPVVSTRLPGIPSDYENHLQWADDNPTGIASAITAVLATSLAARRQRGAAARDFIWSTRGYVTQGLRLRAFLQDVARGSGR